MTHTKADERRMAQLRDSALTDPRLQELLELMLSGAIRRQVWLMFLDEDDRLSELVLPMADYPDDPDEPEIAEDLGPATAAGLLATRIPAIAEMIGCTQTVLVWEREGGEEFTEAERRWARAMADALRGGDVRLRAQFLLHDDGIRVLAPDDYASAR